MILKPNARIYSLLVALSAACFFYTAQAEIILIQENFGGDCTGNLHGTSADDTGTNYFRGPGVSVAGIDPGVLTGTVTFTTVLDLRPEGGYNGTTNFGTVHFSNSLGVGGVQSATFTANQNFNHVGFSYTGADLVANLSQFQVTQIPEPSSLILMGVALLAVVGFRSRIS